MSNASLHGSESRAWRVYKFGGSSLGTPGRLPRVLSLITDAQRPLAVVVSALGDTTDWLISAARAAASGDTAGTSVELTRVRNLARSIASTVLEGPALSAHEATVEQLLAPIERLLTGVELTRECTPATLDEVMSVGERISSELVARALTTRGVPARAVDARTFLVTDETAGSARVDIDASRAKLSPLVSGWEGVVPVITGFIARSHQGRTTTLGRNGSDYTATLLSWLLGAPQVTVWTDVPGVMTADPALVRDAYPVPRMTYAEALELAHFGTRMFHPRTMIPLLESGAALHIRSTTEPEAPGTCIDAEGNPDPHRPTSVTSLERLALLHVESLRPTLSEPLGLRVLQALEAAQVTVWGGTLSAQAPSISLVVPQAQAQRAHAVLEAALRGERDRHEVRVPPPHAPVTLVTLVAESMGHRPNVAGRFFHALGNVGVNVRAILQGASSRSVSCAVDAEDTAVAVRTVHSAFNLNETEINVLLVGKGTVGGRLLVQLAQNAKALAARHGVALRLVGLVDSRRALFDPAGVPPAEALARLAKVSPSHESPPDVGPLLERLSRLSVPVLVDCTAADGMDVLYAEAFRRGIHVVAANKKPLARPWKESAALHTLSREQFRAWHYETTVGASLPVIETLKNLVRTGDRVERIEGCFSGSLGYVCHALMDGVPLSQAVRTARANGYTEPHPRDDLSGLDVARKALILARELGLELDLEDVTVEPLVPREHLDVDEPEAFLRSLTSLDPDVSAQVARYRSAGRSLRYLAQILPHAPGGPRVKVGPVAVDAAHPATGLKGAEAMVSFFTERYREYPLIVRGAGAGGDVTAAGVLADILRLAQNVRGRR
ncbi:bifunctional aspartate kinase/homoserine dehydrogenase I [Archangium violaceum]|uniref:bifunctional aspartate kinase/homoserine dehydrogenase I n=1 Tax=Archangium violaceum TaxID=83451 RepID=UPI00193B3DB8|nr:bifunctional aspartate kinase/homoserine dehydrogenase I [Archangium violaceum]QRK04534.1 bifunctional aspartate kinase/homoserine dehydrogenase I [Archangium violaceum]